MPDTVVWVVLVGPFGVVRWHSAASISVSARRRPAPAPFGLSDRRPSYELEAVSIGARRLDVIVHDGRTRRSCIPISEYWPSSFKPASAAPPPSVIGIHFFQAWVF